MYRILVSTLLALLMATSLSANASGLVTVKDALDYSSNVVMHLSRVQLDDAWRKMKTNTNIPPAQIDMFARQYKAHYEHTIQHYGKAVGVEHVSTEMSGQSFIRVTHLVKYEVKAVAWFMIFYKVRDSWVLNEFNYDINTNTIFNIVAQASANNSEQALARAWQSEVEARLASIEANKLAASGAPQPVIASATMGEQDLAILRETQQRLASLEEKYSLLAQQSPGTTSLDNLSPDTTNSEIATQQMAALGATEQRLANLEERMAAMPVESRLESLSVDGNELETIKKTLEVLKKQHPFAQFPPLH
ncbi:MAG: hypothetical protein VR73_00695 [Gammaproteobacteria bacterium BRH_c0]|nr:MAG: hypothetical protein VR73_00695 [Gammaproteobacteria bacterium BRH_c0]